MILTNQTNSTRESLQIINTFSKVTRYKINSQKSVFLLYKNDYRSEKDIMETTHFTLASNNIKYLCVTLTKQIKDLYDKNFKSLKKEIEEYIRSWEGLPCS